MQKIVTHLWFDREAREAAAFYAGIFDNSRILGISALGDTPSGDVDIVPLELAGREFQFLSAGPLFRFTPAVSFLVTCHSRDEVDRLWEKLHAPGKELMPLGEYPFSPRYGWTEDRYGISWQLMYTPESVSKALANDTAGGLVAPDGAHRDASGGTSREAPGMSITPTMMFVGAQCGKAEEAVRLYTSLFDGSAIDHILPYGPGAEPNAPDMIKHAGFSLLGADFAAMDSAYGHAFAFNEAISFMVFCDSQKEVDRYWDALGADPEAGQCGWLKDRFGLSWQIVPHRLAELMAVKDPEKLARVTTAMLGMKKLDIAGLELAAG